MTVSGCAHKAKTSAGTAVHGASHNAAHRTLRINTANANSNGSAIASNQGRLKAAGAFVSSVITAGIPFEQSVWPMLGG